MVQPWVDRHKGAVQATESRASAEVERRGGPFDALIEVAAEQWLLGLDGVDQHTIALWRSAVESAEALGYQRLTVPARRLLGCLERLSSVVWDSGPAVGPLLVSTAWLRLAQDAG